MTDDVPTAEDEDAYRLIDEFRVGTLARIQKRAGNWIAGLVAVTGVITTAAVINGPDAFDKLEGSLQKVVLTLIVAGGVAIASGIFWANAAAYGNPFREDPIGKLTGRKSALHAGVAWTNAVDASVKSARTSLSVAAWSTIAGTICLALAILLTWTSPATEAETTFTCFKSGTETIKIEGSAPTVSDGQLTIIPCPN